MNQRASTRGLSFKAVFPEALSRAGAPDIVPFTSVRVVVRHSDNSIALDTLIAFPPTADSIAVSLNIRLLPTAPPTGEQLTISLEYINAASVTVFNGAAPVVATPSLPGQDPPPPVIIPVSYSGPGAAAAKVVISPKTQTVNAGGTFQFTAQAFDAANNVIAGTPVIFTSSNTALAVISNAASGSGNALVGRGTVQVTAALLTGGLTDVATLSVQPVLSAIAVVSGSGQSAPAGTQLPLPVVVRVTATDGGAVSGVPVTFVAANAGSVSSSTASTDANGNAQTSWTLGAAAGAQTLSATANGLAASAVFNATATVVTPTKLVVTRQPASAAAGATLTNVVIAAQDANGITSTSFTGAVSIALGANSAGATLSGTTTVNAVAGVATFAGLTLNKAGTGYTLVASSGSLTNATSLPFDITAGAPTQSTFTTQPGNAVAGQPLAPAPVVTVRDALGNTVTSFTGTITLDLAPNGTGAVLGGTTSVVAVAGAATFSALTINKTGVGYQLVASGPGLTAGTSAGFNVAPAAPSSLTLVSGGGQTGAVSTVLAQPVVVVVSDVFGNAIAGQTVAFAVVTGGGTVGTASGATNALGQLSTTWTLGPSGGPQTITASSSGLTALTIGATATTVGTGPASLVFASAPVTMTAGVAGQVVVQARDAQNQLVTTFTGNVTLALGANPVGGTLSGTLTVAAVAGVATFPNISVDKASTGYTYVATSGSLTSSPFAFTVVPAAAASLAFTTQPVATGAGSPISPAAVVTARDAFGNTATGFTGNVAIAIGANPGTSTLTGTTSVAAVAGVATFSTLSLNNPGVGYTLVASASGLTGATSAAFDITAGTLVTQLGFSAIPTSVTAGVAFTPVVQAMNAQGTIVTSFTGNVTLAFAANPAGGTLNGTLTVAAVGGIATFSNISINKAGGGYTIVASSGSLTSPAAPLTVVPAAATSLAFTTQPVTASAGSNITPAVVVTAQDAFGNRATAFTGNVTMAIGSNPGGAILLGTTTVAALAGVATFNNLSLTTIGTGYTLVASASGLSSATSSPFNIIAGGTLTWTNVNGGLWSVASNWSLGRVPQAGDSVVITLSGTYTVTMDVNFTGTTITLGAASGTQMLAMSGRTLTLTGGLRIGSNGVFTPTGSSTVTAGTLVNQGTLNATNTTINAPLVNQGLLIYDGTGSFTNTFTTTTGSTLRLQGSSSTGTSNLTITNGFTNNGTIDLTTIVSGYSDILTVTNGTLTNAAGATITASLGAGGPRTINAQLDNQGTITFNQPLALTRASAAHTNSGTINVTGADWTLNQSGTGASFTNTGTVTIGASRTWTVNGGALNLTAGTVSGAGTLALLNTTANFATGFSNSVTALALNNVIVNGPGTLTNAATQTQSMINTTINAPLVNQGLLIYDGAGSFTNTFTTTTGSTLRLQGSSSTGTSNLTITNGFTNNGTIDLTTIVSGYSDILTVTNGTLTNAAGGTIMSSVGAGGPRTINATVNNQGTLSLATGGTGLLTINGGLATTGVINLKLGGTTAITQYDRLAITGSATLGGTLNVALVNGFLPASTNFTVLTTTNPLSGTFGVTNFPPSITQPPTYNPTSVVLVSP